MSRRFAVPVAAALLLLAQLPSTAGAAYTWDAGTVVYPGSSAPCDGYDLNAPGTSSHMGQIQGLLESNRAGCDGRRLFVTGNSAAGFTTAPVGVKMGPVGQVRASAADSTGTYFLWDQYYRYPGRAIHLTKRDNAGNWTDRVVIRRFKGEPYSFSLTANDGHWWIGGVGDVSDARGGRWSAMVWEKGKSVARLTPRSWKNVDTFAWVSYSPRTGPMVATTAEKDGRTGPVVHRWVKGAWSGPRFVGKTVNSRRSPMPRVDAFTNQGAAPVLSVTNEKDQRWLLTKTNSGWTSSQYRYDRDAFTVDVHIEQGRVWLAQEPYRGGSGVVLVWQGLVGWEQSAPLPAGVYVHEVVTMEDGRLNVFDLDDQSEEAGDSRTVVWTGTS